MQVSATPQREQTTTSHAYISGPIEMYGRGINSESLKQCLK